MQPPSLYIEPRQPGASAGSDPGAGADSASAPGAGSASGEGTGAGAGEPLVLVHGFTQSGRAWGRAGDLLAERSRLLVLDAPGHGRSAEVSAGLPEGADLMASAVGEPADWLGYSMGGRFALHVALRHPESVRRLVLVSATAGIDDPSARAERRRSDERLAQRVTEEGLEAFVRWWVAQPLFSTLPTDAAAIESRLEGTATGLASSLRLAGAGVQEPLWDALPSLTMPVLILTGSLDQKYCDLGVRLVETIGPNASQEVIDGAGHACHLEKPEAFAAVVTSWLAGTPAAARSAGGPGADPAARRAGSA